MKKEIIVISIGGSVIAPDEIDVDFLKKLKNLFLVILINLDLFL